MICQPERHVESAIFAETVINSYGMSRLRRMQKA